jgi:translation machinery-associated protein 16
MDAKKRVVDKLLWYRDKIKDLESVNEDELNDIVLSYINRNIDEITQLKSKTRQGRPIPSRLLLLEDLKAEELKEYNNGIELPNVIDPAGLEALKQFTGDHNSIDRIKMFRFKRPKE